MQQRDEEALPPGDERVSILGLCGEGGFRTSVPSLHTQTQRSQMAPRQQGCLIRVLITNAGLAVYTL